MEHVRRNLDLWEDRKLRQFTFGELSKKYCISRDRCIQIYKRVERKYETYVIYGIYRFDIEQFYFDRMIAYEVISNEDL